MLRRDYITEAAQELGRALGLWLNKAVLEGDDGSIEGIEGSVAKLLDLDAATALALDPDSLVTMMGLSGVADSVAGYASYALLRLGDAYDAAGKPALARIRRDQARAVASAFGWELGQVPEEYQELERALAAERGEE